LANAHSIWEITLHIAAWQEAVLRGLQGGSTNLAGEEDWPVAKDTSEDAWMRTIASLQNGNAKLQHEISKLRDSQLEQIVDNEKRQSHYMMLHGLIQHHLFHAGQIAMLKKS
jgi:DinB superfamily